MIQRPRRTALFMPASNERAVAKARTLACDVVILDLEDAVAPARKEAARMQAVAAVTEGRFAPREIVVRVNAPGSAWQGDDLSALAGAPIDAVLLPKVGGIADIAAARAILGEDGPAIWAMIESAAGLLALPTIVQDARTFGLQVLVAGTNDLAFDLRCRPGRDRAPLLPALAQIVAAARAGGMMALDGVLNAIDDADRLAAECVQGRDWGFDGKTLIHPAQIATANRTYGPSPEERQWASRVVAAFTDPSTIDHGAIRLDGEMVERLHFDEARRILQTPKD